jgi:transcriptional regulator GlxA family with amidase domain
VRRLDRPFRRKLNDSPALLSDDPTAGRPQSAVLRDVPIQKMVLSCDSSGAEVFSRTYRSHFGQSPRELCSNFSTDRLHRFHPEFVQRVG